MKLQNNPLKSIYDHIRLRPGMYVRYLDVRGIHDVWLNLLYKLVDYGCTNFTITLGKHHQLLITSKQEYNYEHLKNNIENIENNHQDFLSFIIIFGVSSKAEMVLKYPDKPTIVYKMFQEKSSYETANTKNTTPLFSLIWKPDENIFKDLKITYSGLNTVFKTFTLLQPKTSITFIDKTTKETQINIFRYPKGLFHLLDEEIILQQYGKPLFRLDLETEINNYSYQICFSYQDIWLTQPVTKIYVNEVLQIFEGSLHQGILKGITKSFKQILKKDDRKVKISSEKIKKKLLLVASIKGENMNYRNSIKDQLDMPKIEKEINKYLEKEIIKYFDLHPEITQNFIEAVRQ